MRVAMLFVILSVAWPASAQECRSWSDMVEDRASYGQIPVRQGLTDPSRYLMTVFVNPRTTTWTIAVLMPQGCVTVYTQGIGWRWLSKRQDDG